MTTLVTGAAGFIGMHVARRLLARGEQVLGIDNLNDYYPRQLKVDRLAELREAGGDRFTFLQVDFADEGELERALRGLDCDRIIHLGAQAGVRYSLENPYAYVRSNLAGHVNLLELARHRSVEHFVYASSSSVYGNSQKLPFSVEDRADHPISFYGATKRADELMTESYAHLYRLPATGLRFFTVYGPWGRPDMAYWTFTKDILAGRPIQLFNHGDMRRDFTYIDDVVAAILLCLDSPPPDDGEEKPGGNRSPHRLYNVGNCRSEELRRLIALIETACGRKAEMELLPLQAGDMTDTFADIAAMSSDLGFAPTTSLDSGIPRFVEWYRAYHQRR